MISGRTVPDDSLTPIIEDVTPHVVLARQRKLPDLQSSRIHHIGSTVPLAAVWPPRSLQRCTRRNPFKHVEQSTMVPFESSTRMVRIVRSPSVHQVNHLIGFVIPIGVFEEQKSWLVNHQHTTIPEFKSSWTM